MFFIGLFNRVIFLISSFKYQKIKKEHNFYSWKFGKIHYRVQGYGPPLLLIHGIGVGASSYEWRKNVPYFSKYFRVYTIDLLGFGQSSKPKITYTAFLYVQLIHDFIRDVIKEPASVIANSQGASFATMAASYSPSLFRKLVLISPTGIKKQESYPTLKTKLIKIMIEMPIIGTSFYQIISSKPYIFYFMKRYLYKSFTLISSSLLNNYSGAAHLNGPSSRYPIASFMGGYMNVNVKNALNQLTSDILIIWGKENELVPPSLLDEWLLIKPSISSYIFNKSKSMPHEEETLHFNETCISFLEN